MSSLDDEQFVGLALLATCRRKRLQWITIAVDAGGADARGQWWWYRPSDWPGLLDQYSHAN